MYECYAGDFLIESDILPLLKYAFDEVTGYYVDHQEVDRCYTRGKSQETYLGVPLPSANKAAYPGFETKKKMSPKVQNRGIRCPTKRTYVLQKLFKKYCEFLGGLSVNHMHSARQIIIGHLGHFLLDFLAQIWTQGTLRHILGPILVIFEICQFLMIRGPFEYFSENGWSQ